jgi:hypothetical protein
LNSAYGLPIQGSSADFLRQGASIFACSAQASSRIHLRKKDSRMQNKGNHRSARNQKFFIADIKHP